MKTIKQLKEEIEQLLILHQAADITITEVLDKFKGFEKQLREKHTELETTEHRDYIKDYIKGRIFQIEEILGE